jgi:prevent-host-death family protein
MVIKEMTIIYMKISAAEAKAKLSAVLHRVEKGETCIIEDRGRPVAALVPIKELPLEERLGGTTGRGR